MDAAFSLINGSDKSSININVILYKRASQTVHTNFKRSSNEDVFVRMENMKGGGGGGGVLDFLKYFRLLIQSYQ